MKLYFLAPLILQKLIWIPTRLSLMFFGHLKISGLQHLRGLKTPVIFASNHISEADVFLIPGSLGFFSRYSPLFYTVREKSFYDTQGWRQMLFAPTFIKAWGGYPVYPGLHNYGEAVKHHVKIVEDGGNLVYFPEGGIPKPGEIWPIKAGIGYLAHATKATVIPVKLEGARMSASDFLNRKRKIYVTFGEPVSVPNTISPVSIEDYKEFAANIMKKIRTLKPDFEQEPIQSGAEAIGI